MSTTSSSNGYHFVLVHGAAHGAWCWYRLRCLLECTGHKVTCPDLKGSGIDTTDPSTISNFDEYNEPLDNILSGLPNGEKVILVGHSAGGLSLTAAIHKHPQKLLVVVFIAAAMYKHGFETEHYVKDEGHKTNKAEDMKLVIGMKQNKQSIVEIFWSLFCHPLKCLLLMIPDRSEEMHYHDSSTSSIPKEGQGETLYQLSPLEDRTLAAMLIRKSPTQAFRSAKFPGGKDIDKVPRVFIRTLHDGYYSQEEQDLMVKNWPPNELYEIDSDHFPMFSNPYQFLGLLLKVSLKFGGTQV